MRTISEIEAKIKAADDLFGTVRGDLMQWLPFDRAKEMDLVSDTATAEKWAEAGFPRPLSDEAAINEIKGYMPFAWDKANNCRGLSAGRSILHMQAWLWLLGADDAQLDDYTHYGKPQLKAICEAFGIDWKALDDGHWRNNEDDAGAGPADSFHLVLPDSLKRAA
jgi:hypothetical protein